MLASEHCQHVRGTQSLNWMKTAWLAPNAQDLCSRRFQYLDLNPYLAVQALLSSRQVPWASMLARCELYYYRRDRVAALWNDWKNEFKIYLWTSFLGETCNSHLFRTQQCDWLCRFLSRLVTMHKKRAEQKTAGIRTKSEQKRELRNLKCSVLRQNNHGYQMPFVVNRLFSWLTLTQRPMCARGLGASYCATQNHRAHGPGFALVEPSHHSVWIIKIWLFLWKSG